MLSGRRETSVSSKPSSRSIRAIASPMPDEPPVTSAAPAIAPTVNAVEAASLTSLTVGGGCAAKYSAARLEELLKGFVPAEAEDLLVGLDPADDAAVYRLDDERALVFTVDFFPPLVDDPALFGRIAATNALNDVFAMGGTPLLALSIAAFPEELATELVAAVFAGADEQVRAAGAILAGGHTIRDTEPKYGLAVVGTVHPDGIWIEERCAARRRRLPHEAARHRARARRRRATSTEAARWMTTLNDRAARGAAAVLAARGHRRHRLRPARARARDGRAQRRADPARRRRRCRRSTARSRRRATESAPAATRATASSPARTSPATACRRSCSRSATTRRRRAASS